METQAVKISNKVKEEEKAIKKFLEIHTNHVAETAVIKKSPASAWDYVVRVENKLGEKVKVNFFFDDQEKEIGYGLAGWGVCTVVKVESLGV